jgi:hypothetical protein
MYRTSIWSQGPGAFESTYSYSNQSDSSMNQIGGQDNGVNLTEDELAQLMTDDPVLLKQRATAILDKKVVNGTITSAQRTQYLIELDAQLANMPNSMPVTATNPSTMPVTGTSPNVNPPVTANPPSLPSLPMSPNPNTVPNNTPSPTTTAIIVPKSDNSLTNKTIMLISLFVVLAMVILTALLYLVVTRA